MSELEDKLNSILGDPAQMEKIAGLARSLMGGGGAPAEETPTPASSAPGIDAGLLQKLGGLLGGAGQEPDREQALLAAMRPYLSEKRRGKMDQALKLARLARIARLAMGETGGGSDEPL